MRLPLTGGLGFVIVMAAPLEVAEVNSPFYRGHRSRQPSTDQPKNASSIFWTISRAQHYLT
jgi:hypothetical protein